MVGNSLIRADFREGIERRCFRDKRFGLRHFEPQRWRNVRVMHIVYQQDAKAVEAQAHLFDLIADAVEECVRLVDEARVQLDTIDREAHEEIQEVLDSKGGWFGPLALLGMIWSILTSARASAQALAVATAGNIAAQGARIATAQGPPALSASGGGASAMPYKPNSTDGVFFAGNEVPRDGAPGMFPQAPGRGTDKLPETDPKTQPPAPAAD